jgi:hypothetical protein
MGKITLKLSEEAESYLRGHNQNKGDMGRYLSDLIVKANKKVKPNA